MTTTPQDEGWIDAREVAEILGRSRVTILRWARDGQIPVAYRGRGHNGVVLFDRITIGRFRDLLDREEELARERARLLTESQPPAG